jgi:hypothetical protein
LVFVESPAEKRGWGFLTVDHDAADQSDERWVYLPNLKRTTRIASDNMSAAFLGSDFSYADLAPPDPSQFTLELKETAPLDGDECWLIVATPRTDRIKQSVGYTQMELWVSKTKQIVLRARSALVGGNTKYLQVSSLGQRGDTWVAKTVTMRTVAASKLQSETTLEILEFNANDASVTDSDFSLQRLERGP